MLLRQLDDPVVRNRNGARLFSFSMVTSRSRHMDCGGMGGAGYVSACGATDGLVQQGCAGVSRRCGALGCARGSDCRWVAPAVLGPQGELCDAPTAGSALKQLESRSSCDANSLAASRPKGQARAGELAPQRRLAGEMAGYPWRSWEARIRSAWAGREPPRGAREGPSGACGRNCSELGQITLCRMVSCVL